MFSKLTNKLENALGVDLNGDGKVAGKAGQASQPAQPANPGYTNPGAPPAGAAPGYGPPPGGAPGYGPPPGGAPGYGPPPGGAPGYGAPPGAYGAPPGGAPGYGPPPGGAPGYGAPPGTYGAPPGGAPGTYGAPPGGPGYGPPPGGAPGYGAPPGAAGYGAPGAPGAPVGVAGGAGQGYPAGPSGGPPGAYPTYNGAPGVPVGYPGAADDRGMGQVAGAVGVGAVAYGVHHHHQQQQQSHHGQAVAAGVAGGAPLAFFNHMAGHQQRNYVLIVDRSGSMGGSRWKQAEEAVIAIAPHICNFDPDGITLYLFDNEHKQFDNVKDANRVREIFKANGPRGSTNLADVLEDAFKEHHKTFHRTRRGTTILVVTDGAPDSKDKVIKEIREATHKMESDPELSVSFIQVGDDHGAERFLKELDDKITGCKYDIVDTLKASDMKQKSFADMIQLSIND